jgi:hypothetical protein
MDASDAQKEPKFDCRKKGGLWRILRANWLKVWGYIQCVPIRAANMCDLTTEMELADGMRTRIICGGISRRRRSSATSDLRRKKPAATIGLRRAGAARRCARWGSKHVWTERSGFLW